MKKNHIAKILNNRGLLVDTRDETRLAVRYVPRVGNFSAYALSFEEFGHEKPPSAAERVRRMGPIIRAGHLQEVK